MSRIPVSGTVVLDGLTRRFGRTVAVDGLSFEVAEGELFGLVGPDGAGKTTTLRMLAGVLRPSTGEAVVAGVPMSVDPEAAKPHLAYMAQRFGLYEDLTVRENLSFYADLFRVPKKERPERLERLYRFSRLDEFQDRLAGALSGGMKQKLALSCALVHQPRILLLDEPTFGVDPISRRELWVILDEMVASGTTVVVSTSYLDEAERCSRVGLLHEGGLLALDTPAALRRTLPGSLWSVRGDDPRALRDRLRTAPGVVGAALFGDVVHAHLQPGVAWSAVAAHIADSAPGGARAEPIEASLEDVFIERVRRAGRTPQAMHRG
ncbi:MAG: ABC transporter ATP-binding protein [Longimicrobiales bacterium]|nr:ABC transporter ATP-binding protein [Longimicrobiales bacterium]